MIEAVVKLIEKLSELGQVRAERRRDRYELIVKPLYGQLKGVHNNYLLIFESAKADLECGHSLERVASTLRSRRIEEEAERHGVLEQTLRLRTANRHDELRPFLDAVAKYFSDTPFSGHNTPSNGLLHAIRAEIGAVGLHPNEVSRSEHDLSRASLVRAAEMCLRLLRNNWSYVSSEYANLLSDTVR